MDDINTSRNKPNKDNSVKVFVPIIVIMSMFAGALLFRFFGHISSTGNDSSNEINSSYAVEKLKDVYQLIDNKYVDSVDINNMVEELIPDMLSQLDPHSVYIPAKSVDEVNEDLDGNFVGVGVQFNIQNDTVMIVDVVSGGPSQNAGILPGDRIVKVDDSLFVGEKITNSLVFKKLKGKKGSQVKLAIKRPQVSDLLEFDIKRGEIPVNSVNVSYLIKGEIGYIKVDKFGRNTYNEFLIGLNKLYKDGMKGLIVDLRSNGGGYMETAINMINLFLPPKKLIVYTEGKSQPREDFYSSGKGIFTQLPLAVLVDDWSASASEIFSGAMQDNDRGIIVGRRTFGKGLVQQQMTLDDESAIRLTIARYHTPSGRCIQKPYKDEKEYEMDIYNRMNHGEFTEVDSIKQDESLKFSTTGGRTVYGGGGIMPDYFVPVDTTRSSVYFRKVSNPGYIYQFAFKYVDENRALLKTFNSVSSLTNYLDQQNILNKFILFAEKKGIDPIPKDIKISESLIKERIYAYIARNTHGDEFFYRILEDGDPVIKKAVEEINFPILK